MRLAKLCKRCTRPKEQSGHYCNDCREMMLEYKRLAMILMARIKTYLKGKGYPANSPKIAFLGCNKNKLIKHFEKRFLPGMTWENHGLEGWHIDHIRPICSATSIPDVVELNHYTNLQPLWAKDNLMKSGNY